MYIYIYLFTFCIYIYHIYYCIYTAKLYTFKYTCIYIHIHVYVRVYIYIHSVHCTCLFMYFCTPKTMLFLYFQQCAQKIWLFSCFGIQSTILGDDILNGLGFP